MKLNNISVVVFYLLGSVLGVVLYLTSLSSSALENYEIFFYRGLILLAIGTAFHLAILMYSKQKISILKKYSFANCVAIAMISVSFNATFLIVIPVSLDRSVSVFLLGYLNNHGGRLKRDDLEQGLEKVYLKEYRALDRRLNEQLKSGNIVLNDKGEVVLTDRGFAFIWVSKRIVHSMNIDDKYVNPAP